MTLMVTFYNNMNVQHANIRFTMEKGVDNKLEFQDVQVHDDIFKQKNVYGFCYLLTTLASLLSATKLAL